jgi:uncharacterized ParB-like nuclease family protein
MNLLKIKIEELNTRDLQTRAALNEDTVSDYAEAMERGDKFPPVTVFTDGAEYYLADGFHRVEALRRIGKKSVMAELQDGDYKAALLYALKANSTHGLRRTNADKRHALEMAWNAREHLFGGEPSQNLLADTCGISRKTVERFMAEQGRNSSYPMPNQVATMSQGDAPAAPTMPMRPIRPITAENGNAQAENVQVSAPTMPVRRVGRDGKTYPVRPAMPTRPAKPAHVVPLDRFGVEIPVEINGAFEQDELNEVIRNISDARSVLRSALEAGVEAFKAVRQDALIQLNNAYSFVKSAKAHCVCRICQGNGCKACHERGWQTEEEYERNPKEFKA